MELDLCWERKSFNMGLAIGLLLWMSGLVVPAVLTVKHFGIYSLLETSIVLDDSGTLVISAFFLVLLNSLRALPIYIGTFLICSSMTHKKIFFLLSVPVLIWFAYFLISIFYGIEYDFGYPSFLAIVIIYLLDWQNLYNVAIFKHTVVLIFVLIGVQFLDMLPELTRYGFGKGVVSMDIKTAASLIDGYDVLSMSSIAFMAVFLFMGVLLSVLLRDQHKLLITAQRLSEANLRSLEDRRNTEIRCLVHDLKTPLTTIQGLAGVIAIISECDKIRDYATRIEDSTSAVSSMISQILYDDQTSDISVEELLDYIRFQIVSLDVRDVLTIENRIPQAIIRVNKILFSRALINVIDNAYAALDKNKRIILLRADRREEDIEFSVFDNGRGIREDDLRKIWDIGYSNRGSTGLGLNFIRKTVEDCGGSIVINSKEGEGTTVNIVIKGC